MQAKDRYLEKINLLLCFLSLCFSHNLYAKNIYEEVFNYNETLKNSSVNFIQTNNDYVQGGVVFFGDKRIKITYTNPQNLTIILSEKKGMYINHELRESDFFLTKKSFVKFFYDIFHKKSHIQNMSLQNSDGQIEFSQKIQLDNVFFNIKLIYENSPILLRRLEVISEDENIQLGFFDHRSENVFDKKFFSMIDPYLN